MSKSGMPSLLERMGFENKEPVPPKFLPHRKMENQAKKPPEIRSISGGKQEREPACEDSAEWNRWILWNVSTFANAHEDRTQRETFLKSWETAREAEDQRFQKMLQTVKEGVVENSPSTHGLVVRTQDGRYLWKKEEQADRPVSLATILTSGTWGAAPRLDPATVPLEIRQRAVVEEHRQRLVKELDLLVAADPIHRTRIEAIQKRLDGPDLLPEEREHLNAHLSGLKGKARAYQALGQRAEEGIEKEKQRGVLAERMVRDLLDQTARLLGNELLIFAAPISADVEYKMDFVILVRNTAQKRGVGVQSSDADVVGIQFTLAGADPNVYLHKTSQVQSAQRRLQRNGISDLVLVSVPVNGTTYAHNRWEKEGCPPGGPEQFWDAASKQEILRRVLQNILPPERIKQYIEAME
ncbi:MAG TPA: DUF2934 domain-containing protein [Patescibacteria group bacterium]|nr:DUF2934 domain-containing protein [Patescibacteria group bacterium]